MAAQIVKNLTVTRVKFSIVEVVDGVPSFNEQPDAVFRGEVSAERVKKLLAKEYGDKTVVILGIDSGRHRFVMNFDDFVRNAVIADESAEDDSSEDAGVENVDPAVDDVEDDADSEEA